MKTTIELFYDKKVNDNYDNANELLKDYLRFDKANERRRPDSEELNDDVVFQRFSFKIQFGN